MIDRPLSIPTCELETLNANKQLLYSLKLPAEEKADLWLVKCGAKPATDLAMSFRQEGTQSSSNDLKKFIENNNLFYAEYDDFLVTRRGQATIKTLAVSSKPSYAIGLAVTSMHAWHKWQEEQLGKIYGFPRKAIRSFTEMSSEPSERLMSPRIFHNQYINSWYWVPYTSYLVREQHAYEDSLVGRKWADIIRHDLPELAKEIESRARNATFS